MSICKVCSHSTSPFTKARILEKYDIQYFQCRSCGFVQTETPYWLEEAYSDAINDSDVGLVNRNILLSKVSKALILSFFDSNAKFMDYGGGYGLFVRIMRDYGFDFYRYDRYCPNIFAKGLDADLLGKTSYELVTAFEVFEHLIHPLDELEYILSFSNSIFFSTTLIPENNPKPHEWWYYGLDHGQHTAIYTLESLFSMAERFRLYLYSDRKSLHMLTTKKIPFRLFQFASRHRVATLISALSNKRPLIGDDYLRVTGKVLHD